MEDFEVRLRKERDDLAEKIEKLSLFMGTSPFGNLEVIQVRLLRIQLASMKTYEQCLAERIAEL